MPVTNVKTKWSSGDLIFEDASANELLRVSDSKLRGDFEASQLKINGTAVTSTAAELNKLDTLTAVVADLELLAGQDAAGLVAGDFTKLAALTASAADINSTSGAVGSITVVAANAAANTIDVVITVLDPDGVAITNVVPVDVFITDLSDGTGGSVHTHSTTPSFTVGEEIVAHIAADYFRVLTTAAGTCTLRLVDTANEDVTINAVVGTVRGSDTTVAGDWSA